MVQMCSMVNHKIKFNAFLLLTTMQNLIEQRLRQFSTIKFAYVITFKSLYQFVS